MRSIVLPYCRTISFTRGNIVKGLLFLASVFVLHLAFYRSIIAHNKITLISVQGDRRNWSEFLDFIESRGEVANNVNRPSSEGWPPSYSQLAIDDPYELYDLSLTVNVDQLNDADPTQEYYNILELLDTQRPVNGSYLKRLYHRDKHMRVNSDPADYIMYPQFIDVSKTIDNVRKGEPVAQRPINNPYIGLLQSPKNTCCPKTCDTKYDVIVLIKTCVHCYSRRNRARKTYMVPNLWNNFNIKFVFLLGIPGRTGKDHFHFDGVNVTMASVPHNYKNNTWQLMREITNESATYGDMLIGTFEDTYFNLTMKMMLGFRWSDIFCQNQCPLYFFIDDDMAIVPRNLIKFVQKIPDSYKKKFVGGREGRTVIVRPGDYIERWSVSEDELPWPQYTPYYYGIGYFLGSDVVQDLSILASFTKPLRIDDAYLGIMLKKLRIPMLRLNQIHLGSKDNIPLDAVLTPADVGDQTVNWTTGALMNDKN